MPVEDHAIHPSTILADDAVNGCHSAVCPPRAAGYWAPDGYVIASREYTLRPSMHLCVERTPRFRWVPDVMSKECQQIERRKTDPRCQGCAECK